MEEMRENNFGVADAAVAIPLLLGAGATGGAVLMHSPYRVTIAAHNADAAQINALVERNGDIEQEIEGLDPKTDQHAITQDNARVEQNITAIRHLETLHANTLKVEATAILIPGVVAAVAGVAARRHVVRRRAARKTTRQITAQQYAES